MSSRRPSLSGILLHSQYNTTCELQRSSMPQTEEAAAWFAAVYQAVQEIPHGKVTSYGHIATLVGYPERPRLELLDM
jgi:O6-methylguanine-DNA--protein-cysteine methyltransferase